MPKNIRSKLAIKRKIKMLTKEIKVIREKTKRYAHRGEYQAWACHRITILQGQIEGLQWTIGECVESLVS